MNFHIRAFKPDDIPEIIQLQHAAVPLHPWSQGELERDLDRLEPHLQYHFLVAESDGRIVGATDYHRPAGSYHPHKFFLDLFVHPDHQGHGIGRALYDAVLEELLPLGPLSVAAQVRESDPRAIRFAANRGFTETKRDFESVLDTQSFDFSVYDSLERKLEYQGIHLKTFREVDTPAFRRHFHEVFEGVRLDVPRAEPPTPLTFKFFEENVIDEPEMLPDVFVFAMHNDRIVGFTGGYRGAKPGWMDTWLTAVLREARGKNVATAVKVRAIRNARDLGFTSIRTDNDTRNAAMLAVNEKLGFARQPAVISVRKVFREE
jgi:GNAT superfamily N-acetyltransferase